MSSRRRRGLLAAAATLALTVVAHASLPAWLQHVVGASTAEGALYRLMPLPVAQVLYPRPPAEAQGELARLLAATPTDSALYALRARADESALDFTAAAADWKLCVTKAADPIAARLELADYYQRRLETAAEILTLREVAAAPSGPSERFTSPGTQRSWRAFERILATITEQGLPASETQATYAAFLARYPDQPAVYVRAFEFLLEQRQYAAAADLISRFHAAFPQDAAFPVRAQALLDARSGDPAKALSLYDRAFQPLWPADLIASYYALLAQTHQQRTFVAHARAQLAQHPDGPEALNALARIFYYHQQQGHLEAAQQALNAFRSAREQRNGAWSAQDLYTLAALSTSIHSYAEAARYYYALASTAGTLADGQPAAQAGLAGLVDTLLSAPEQPLALGAGNLTLYRDIATLDQGPGYWNGILSLWLNGTSPQTEYDTETAKAQSYFHRSKAAELLAELDRKYPAAPQRAALHLQLIHVYAEYGEPAAVITAGKELLSAFPSAPDRLDVVNLIADAYVRQGDTAAELALYDTTLAGLRASLEKPTGGMPLSAATAVTPEKSSPEPAAGEASQAPHFDLGTYTPSAPINGEANAYASLLDRYLGRLVALNQLPRALTMLRHQLDLSPNDPALYERVAAFLQQNNLSGQQEQTYKAAIAQFQHTNGAAGFYDKLARLYLRQRNADAYAALTRQVTDIFSGSELEGWLSSVGTLKELNPQGNIALGPRLALQLNLYAEKRFPHDLAFTRHLAEAYTTKPTADAAAYEALLRRHWWQDDQLRSQFFQMLSSAGKLKAELAQLQPLAVEANPAASRELAEAEVWGSNFEQAAPLLGGVARLYPADADVGDRAVSLFRSLSYLDATPASLQQAVAIETHLAQAAPAESERLATLGDLYAEATASGGENLAAAAPYWRRIPAIHPGSQAGYLEAATIFWDYFQFEDALAELQSARQHFVTPALYGYETGAIAENRRDLPTAVREYAAAAATSAEARSRLIELASRPATRSLVDAASVSLLAQHSASVEALTLRADILTAQHRNVELAPLFDQALGKAVDADEAASIAGLAQARSLTPTYQHGLARQAELTTDPVEKIQLSYKLAGSLEAAKKTADASRIMAEVHEANPRVLGVVRATTDFYARTDQPKLAIATLLEAAKVSTAPLARSFTLEAAQKANDANDPAQARKLALTLLPATPYDAQVLGILAASYARANDDAGLKSFYEGQLANVKTAPAAERKQDTALLRRGLIPALTRLKDYAGAVNQYIALLSAYPEDSATAQEAALYALRYDRRPQLIDFLRGTVQQSPDDSRFAILLAQVDTTFEDLPGALAAYDAAIRVRKDRVDLYQARTALELRLGLNDPAQLEAAAADFNHLYLLTYKDPAWMVRLAELRARQQRPAESVKALETAYITGRPVAAGNSFRVAAQLAEWNLLTEARTFAQQGITLAGKGLLTPKDTPAGVNGAAIYARILTRLGQPEQALGALAAARRAIDISITYLADLAEQLTAQGVEADDVATQRSEYLKQQRATADVQLTQAVNAMGLAVQTYFTPEQKAAFAQTLDRLHAAPSSASISLAAATAAGLADREASWRRQLLLNAPLKEAAAQREPFAALQRSRLQSADLARALELYAARLRTPAARTAALQQAAQAWRDAGDESAELRLDRTLATRDDIAQRDRFFDLLLRHDPSALAALAASNSEALADSAANFALAHADRPTALAAVNYRARTLPALWRPATAALVDIYFADARTPVNAADFIKSLNPDATIAERLGGPPAQQLTGDLWFYYGSRYGIYLVTAAHTPQSTDPEDFLPAELEGDPTSAAGYLHLAQTYGEAGNLTAATAEFNDAFELAPNDIAAHDSFAVALYPTQPDQALAQWRTALSLLARMQQRNNFSEEFYSGLTTTLGHLGERHLAPRLRAEIDAILGPYLVRNGNYRSNELLAAAYAAAGTPAQGIAQILDVTAKASTALEILGDLNKAGWLDPAAHEQLLLREIELARNQPAEAQSALPHSLAEYQSDLLTLYLDRNELAKAQALLDSISAQAASSLEADRIILAVRSGHLAALLQRWRDTPDTFPEQAQVDTALRSLQQATPLYTPSPAAIRPLLEFLFEQKQLANTLLPTDFLSLAESRITTGDLPGALQLLNRLTLRPTSTDTALDATAVPDPYANFDSAARLLETTHHPSEAVPFLTALTSAQPWNSPYRLRLAQALAATSATRAQAVEALVRIIPDAAAPYAARIRAAAALRPLGPGATVQPGSAELALLLAPQPSAAAARQPYFTHARIAAAGSSATPAAERIALLREAVAIDPAAPSAQTALLDLLKLQAASSDAPALIALVEHLQQAPAAAASASDSATEPEDTAGDAADEAVTEAPEERTPLPAITRSLDPAQRIHLAEQIAAAYRKQGQHAAALRYLELAVDLSAKPDASLIRQRDALQAAIELDTRNAARRPLIHKDLAQPGQVRPRLALLAIQPFSQETP